MSAILHFRPGLLFCGKGNFGKVFLACVQYGIQQAEIKRNKFTFMYNFTFSFDYKLSTIRDILMMMRITEKSGFTTSDRISLSSAHFHKTNYQRNKHLVNKQNLSF